MPALTCDDVAAAAAARLRPGLDLGDRLTQDPLLDRLAFAVQRLELLGERVCLALVLGEQQGERGLGPAQPAGRVDPRREPEADRRLVDRGGVDVGDAHQCAQTGPLRLCEPPQAEQRERAVLVDERHDVGDGGERDDVQMALEKRVIGAEQRLRELPDDPGAAQSGEGVVPLERRDDGTGGESRRRAGGGR